MNTNGPDVAARKGYSWIVPSGFFLLFWAAGCGSPGEAGRTTAGPKDMSKEDMHRKAQLYQHEQQYDSAVALYGRAGLVDSAYVQPVRDLAQLYYELAQRAPEESTLRRDRFLAARAQYARLESRGVYDADLYDRLCELSVLLHDDRAFLSWAKKNAQRYPYDRQQYNLVRAYFDTDDFQGVIRTAKVSLEKFPDSPYISSFYRILGQAYMKVDRDQTAERILTAGVSVTDRRIAGLGAEKPAAYKTTDQYRRLHDDKVYMLLLLKQLHTTYRAQEKLQQVERQLKQEGYDR